MMKNYLLFAYQSYYPYGGCADFTKDFDTVKEAIDFFVEQQPGEEFNIARYSDMEQIHSGYLKWDSDLQAKKLVLYGDQVMPD